MHFISFHHFETRFKILFVKFSILSSSQHDRKVAQQPFADLGFGVLKADTTTKIAIKID